MPENEIREPKDILNEIYANLQSGDDATILRAIAELGQYNFSSEAVRNQLEQLFLRSNNEAIRTEALAALNLPPQRHVQSRLSKMNRGERSMLLREINGWEKDGSLETQKADLLRRRYDFDFTTQTEANIPKPKTAAPPVKAMPESPRPSLLQTLVSEASIKIYLYLGAFFVIASAAIFGAIIPELRIPILSISSLIFGGLAIAIKKRLPQPSFALYIVFSFLLPITANTIQETLIQNFDLSPAFKAGYWVFVYFGMALVWTGSTWFYESRLFSMTAFVSLALAFFRMGDIFHAELELNLGMAGIAVMIGAMGVGGLKKWRDAKFALPLFLTAQFMQATLLAVSISIFGMHAFDPSRSALSLWQIGTFFTWTVACAFYIFSNSLFPFAIFPWLAAGTLIPLPWFIATAFDIESLGSTILLFGWGVTLAIASEIAHRFELTRKYSLPVLLASLPTFAMGLLTGFSFSIALGMISALVTTITYTFLHVLRGRWMLWTVALFNFVVAYFAFFNLDLIQKLDVFFGYQLLVLSMLFLLPDLFLKKDLSADKEWRFPPRIFGALFTIYTTMILLVQSDADRAAICFGVFTLFFAAYTLAHRKALLGYIPAAYLPLMIIFTLKHFNLDAWMPALTVLAVLYFIIGIAVRAKEAWSLTCRNSALILGALLAFTALFLLKESGGWYALVIGLLFIAEMSVSRNGWFELGAPVLFSIGAFLILRDFNFERVTFHVLAYSLIWIVADLLAHLTFTDPRPLKTAVRIMGGLLAVASYGFLFTESDASFAAFGFGAFTLLFLTVSLLYRRATLFYAFTLTLPLFVTFVFRIFEVTKWIHPVIFIALMYYAAGFFLLTIKRATTWGDTLLYSGLGLGIACSVAAPVLGGLDAVIPVAVAATLWAAEALRKKNVWLALPANGLYLLAYFIILVELNVDELQFFSMGAALLGLFQHYLLTRADARKGAFVMGMLSQFVLLGTTYTEMVNRNELIYFVVLFFQSLAVLVYGIVIRSRSLTFFPIGFVVLGVVTVVYSALEGVAAIFLIGCTGVILLMLGILAVLARERISKLGERISDWKA